MLKDYNNKMLKIDTNIDSNIAIKNLEKLCGIYFRLKESDYTEFQRLTKKYNINVNKTYVNYTLDIIAQLQKKEKNEQN